MMTWNYRVLKTKGLDEVASETGETYSIHEVYYNDSGSVEGMTETAFAMGETLEELKENLDQMYAAMTTPVLDLDLLQWAKDDGIS